MSSAIQMELSLKRKLFLIFLFHFWNLHQMFNILKKNIILIATLFRRLQTVKNLVRPLSKNNRSRTPFDSQHVKRFQVVVKSS